MNNAETPSTPPAPEATQTQVPTPPPTPTPTSTPEIPAPSKVSSSTPTAIGSAQGQGDGMWVSKEQYATLTDDAEKLHISETRATKRIRAFYILLSISGLLLAVLYIGLLLTPAGVIISKGNCTPPGAFAGVAFYLNPLAYLFLLATGIVGVTTKRGFRVALGIIFIIVAPIAWFVTGLAVLGLVLNGLCGV